MGHQTLLDTQELVRQLTRVEAASTPFLTVYLDTRLQNSFQGRERQEELRLFLKHMRMELERQYQDSPDFSSILAMLDRLESAMEKLPPSTQGWAVFLRDADGYFKTFESPLPFQNEWTLEASPNLRQLLRLLENHEPVLAVFMDSRSAKIFEVALHHIIDEQQIESDVPGWHKQGGWSQLKYQHHIQDHKEHHYQRVSDRLVQWMDSGRYQNVVLLGEREHLAALKRHVPERILRSLVESGPMAKYETNGQIISRLQGLLHQLELEKENTAVEEVLDQTFSGGFATSGIENTLRAAQLGQIDRLYLLDNLVLEGWRCAECGLFGGVFNVPKAGCPYCGSDVEAASLVEELVLCVKRQEGEVDFVHAHPRLSQQDGLAARLRFKVEAPS